MKLIRQAAAALALWALVTYAWAGLSHLSGGPGPARAATATMGLVASAIELIDPPNALGGPQRFAAAQIRRTAHTAGRVHGAVERSAGAFLDRLGHDRAHVHAEHRVRLHDMVRLNVRIDDRTFSSLDREKLRRRLEKLLDLLEDLDKPQDGG